MGLPTAAWLRVVGTKFAFLDVHLKLILKDIVWPMISFPKHEQSLASTQDETLQGYQGNQTFPWRRAH